MNSFFKIGDILKGDSLLSYTQFALFPIESSKHNGIYIDMPSKCNDYYVSKILWYNKNFQIVYVRPITNNYLYTPLIINFCIFQQKKNGKISLNVYHISKHKITNIENGFELDVTIPSHIVYPP